jgi:enterochelin esterase-like enzyme
MRIAKLLLVISIFVVLASCQPATGGNALSNETKTTLPPTAASAPTSTPIPEVNNCLTQPGRVERVSLDSNLLNDPYTVSIYTPPCYGIDAAKKYPVLYLLHGQNMDDTFWLSLGAAEIADQLIAAGNAPFLMVMPFEEKNFDIPTESKFGDSVMQELIPWFEQHYSVCTERNCRAIGGISRGGGWAMRLAMRNFDMFGAVGGHSMGPMAGDWWQAQKHLETHTPEEYPRIYIDRGEDDFLAADIDSFEKVLASNGIPHEYHINPGRHEKAYWQAHVAEYLQWYAEGWN